MKEMNEYQWDVLESAIRSLQREKYNFFNHQIVVYYVLFLH